MNTLKSRWATVAVFCLLTALNGFQFQNFAGKVNIAKDVFSASEAQINALYSLIFIVVCVFLVPIMICTEAKPWITAAIGAVSCAATSWLRLLAVEHESYSLAIAACIPNGIQATVVVTGLVQLVHRLFRAEERPLIMQLCIQANYIGWGAGTIVGPYAITSEARLIRVLLFQACISTFALGAFICFYRLPPPAPQLLPEPSHSLGQAEEGSVGTGACDSAGGVANVLFPTTTALVGAENRREEETRTTDAELAKQDLKIDNGDDRYREYEEEDEDDTGINDRGRHRQQAGEDYVAVKTTSPMTALDQRFTWQNGWHSESDIALQLPTSLTLRMQISQSLQRFYVAMKALSSHRSFMRHCFFLSIYTGIGYAIPGVQNEIFEDGLSLGGHISGWASFIFIASGVIAGLYLGAIGDKKSSSSSSSSSSIPPPPPSLPSPSLSPSPPHSPPCVFSSSRENNPTATVGQQSHRISASEIAARRHLSFLSFGCTASVCALLLVQAFGLHIFRHASVPVSVVATVICVLMVPAGATSLGLLGVGFNVIVTEVERDIGRTSTSLETYSTSLVEGATQLATALIVQCSSSDTGYLACTIAGFVAFAAVALDPQQEHGAIEEESAGS